MFETHKLNEQGLKEMHEYKEKMSVTVSSVMNLMSEGREKSIFKTKIEEAVFFGAKAIAAKPENFTEIINYTEVGLVKE
jgi:hypothetical protein